MAIVPPFIVAYLTIAGILLLMSVISNFLVIIVVLRKKKMRTATNILICNLAMSDIFLGGFVLPQNLHDLTHTEEYHEGVFACKTVNALPVFCILLSIYSLVLMSWERFQAIVHPHNPRCTLKKAIKLIVIMWMFVLACIIPTLVEYTVYTVKSITTNTLSLQQFVEGTLNQSETTCLNYEATALMSNNTNTREKFNYELWSSYSEVTVYFDTKQEIADFLLSHAVKINCPSNIKYYVTTRDVYEGLRCGSTASLPVYEWLNGLFLVLVAYVVPSIVIWVNYGRVIHYIVKYTKRQEQDHAAASNFILFKKKVKIVKMLAIVAALFELCWLPYFTILVYAKVTGDDDSQNLNGIVNMIRVALSVFSVSYNVYLYLIYNTAFRTSFITIFKCRNSSVQPVLSVQGTLAVTPTGRS